MPRAIFIRLLFSLVAIGIAGLKAQSAEEALNDRLYISAATADDGWKKDLRNAASIFYDGRADELFVADIGNHRVVVYTGMLLPKFSFDHFVTDKRSGRQVKGEPRDLVTNSYGDIILLDNLASYLDILDFRGNSLEQIELAPLLGDSTLELHPRSIAIDEQDNYYVLVSGDLVTILVLDSRFDLVRQIGRKGDAEADFDTPLNLCVRGDLLVVTDLYATPAVKVFDTAGNYRFGFGGHEIDRADMSFPSGVTVIRDLIDDYSIWVSDGLRQVIKVFNQKGEFYAHVGGYGIGPGEFQYPADIVTVGDSAFVVVERIGNRIQRFDIKSQD